MQPEEFVSVLPRVMYILFRDFEFSQPGVHLRKTHQRAMLLLDGQGELPMTEISKHLGMEKASATSLIDTLTAMRLVKRQRQAHDRRVVTATLTPEGRTVAQSLRQALQRHARRKLSFLSRAERADFLKALTILNRLTNRLEPGGDRK